MARRVCLSPAYTALNITSLVDIALSLLTLFIIITPFLHQSLDLKLPAADGKPAKTDDAIMVTITAGGRLLVDGTPVPRDSLAGMLAARLAPAAATPVYISADRSIPYGQVVDIMDRIKGAGVVNLGIVTQPR